MSITLHVGESLLVAWDLLRLPSRVWWACWRVTCLVNHYGSIWWSGADRIWILVSLILIESLLACRLMGDTSIHGYVAQRALWVSSFRLCGVVTVRGCLLCADTCSYSVVGFNSSSLTCWNSWSWLSPKSQAWSARFAENFPIIWFTIPMKRRNLNTFVGICIPRIAAVLSESAVIPYSSTTWPRSVSLFWLRGDDFAAVSAKTHYWRLACWTLLPLSAGLASHPLSAWGAPLSERLHWGVWDWHTAKTKRLL